MYKFFLSDFLRAYQQDDMLRCHMPGHKGKSIMPFPEMSAIMPYDITEIEGADSLFEASGILLHAEKETAALYGSGAVCYSAGGSTLCIQAMAAKMKAEQRTVIAGRTVHRSFLHACVLLDLPVRFLFPENGDIISGTYPLTAYETALQSCTQTGEKACVYVTSPDYMGHIADIGALATLCRRYDAPLFVDNAHGAHLAFLKENRHPMALGADFCCDSAHKLLPALTGGAWLHCRRSEDAPEMKQYMQMFGSTSPSYLIMQSLETASGWISSSMEQIRYAAAKAELLRRSLSAYHFLGEDPFHLTIAADGVKLSELLRKDGIMWEYADRTCLVLLLSPVMTDGELDKIHAVLQSHADHIPPPAVRPHLTALPERVMSLRQAALSVWETVPLSEAEERICGPVQVPCPPAVPLVLSGERLNREWLKLMAFYGIRTAACVIEK